jgi:hypothetical protein
MAISLISEDRLVDRGKYAVVRLPRLVILGGIHFEWPHRSAEHLVR